MRISVKPRKVFKVSSDGNSKDKVSPTPVEANQKRVEVKVVGSPKPPPILDSFTGDVKEFTSDRAKLKYVLNRLNEINEMSWGPIGHSVYHLLREVGEEVKYNNRNKRQKKARKK